MASLTRQFESAEIVDYRTVDPALESATPPLRVEEPNRIRLAPFPLLARNRWALRGAFATPFIIFSVIIETVSNGGLVTVNDALIARVQDVEWNRADIAWISDLYPPLSTMIAAAVPSGLGLALIGSLVAGVLIQRVLEAMVQRHLARTTIAALVVALAANPLFVYTATQNLPAMLGISFFGVGASELVRFVVWRNTQAGFSAGLLFMFAALSDQSGALYVWLAVMAAPMLRLGRTGQPGARLSNAWVIAFPTISAFAAIVFLDGVFLGEPFAAFEQSFSFDPARLAIFPALFTTVNGALLLAPVLSAWLIGLLVRRPGFLVVSTGVFAALLGGYLVGAIPDGSAGNVYLIMLLLAISALPRSRTTLTTTVLGLLGVLQIVIAWSVAFNRPFVLEWMASVVRAFTG